MSGPKKRKVDSECRVFKREWTTKYFFTEVRSMPVCLICQETLAVFKEYNLSHHFATKHGNYASKQSPQEREATAQRLMAKLQAQQNVFHRQTAIQDTTTEASFMLSFKLAKASKPLSEGEFLKECMIETAGLLCPESKGKFEKLSLSRRTVTHRVELIDEDLASKLNSKAEFFKFYSLALDESNDVKDTAQLLIFIRGISDNFEITEEFLAMEPLKGKTRGEDLYDRVSTVIEKMKLPWSKLANVTTDGSPNLTGKNQNPETAPEEVKLELIDLQSDFVLMEKFSSLELRDFYASLNEATFPNIRRMAQKILVLFGSTCVCEQTFSVMNINKAPHRSSLTDEHLKSILRIATTKLTPDFDALAKKGDQQHCSH
uniref:Uncharacterized protein n=1 Tax=Myotis myotis TaxID=51298 RepID=A0A7J7T5S1_MYOMY|nr:hypothetical protein mMyoMyo1_009163 [Myotis myotis]